MGHSHSNHSVNNNQEDRFFDEEAAPHVTPFNTYMKVGVALFVLTFLTVTFHMLRQYMGPLAPFIAFSIAAVKAYLVLTWFMHLKYDTMMNRVIFGLGFFFLALLFTITAIDIFSRTAVVSPL